MHVREKKEDADFKIDLATSNGRIELGGVDGTIRLIISAATTTAIDWQTGVYDLQLIIGSDVKRFIEGSIHVSYGVTR